MANKDYSNWTKEQLVEEVARLRKRKRYGLVWEEKPEDVVEQCKTELPVLKEVKNKAIAKDKNGPVNILIEGDNFHALSVLNYTHKGKIDCIYIDPPYNTGAKDWKYNNHFVDINDGYRHSKWISMMNNRLVLAKKLLKPDGVLIVTIDDWEAGSLRLLLDEIFPERETTTVVIEHNPKGLPSKNFSYSHEYAYFVIPKGKSVIGKDPTEKEDTRNLRRAGKASMRKDRPTMFYPIYVKNMKVVRVGTPPSDSFHPKARNTVDKKGEIAVWPIDDHGRERRWHFGLDSVNDYLDRILIKGRSGDIQLYVTAIPGRYKTVWTGGEFDAGKYGTGLVKEITGIEFPFPKSVYATAKCLETIVLNKPDATILDFFSGSGTTGHATKLINSKFGGRRKFILCTNNENNIATDVCYPRLMKVMLGYKSTGGESVAGLGGNLKYFRTAFVGAEPNDKNKEALTKQSAEMLCMREDTFEPVKETGTVKIFKNAKQHTGIVFDEDSIPALKKEINKIGGVWSVYIFSLGDDTFEEEFEEMKGKITVAPIPEAILRVYRRLFKP
jgi:adenine-specific DNA-methyltransferase